jgi:hypothetical protein
MNSYPDEHHLTDYESLAYQLAKIFTIQIGIPASKRDVNSLKWLTASKALLMSKAATKTV